jgi:hypothetical protein
LTRLRAALVALAAIALATAACSAPAYAGTVTARTETSATQNLAPVPTITAVHVWRHRLVEPSWIGITVRTSSCATNLQVNAVRAAGNAIRQSRVITAKGRVFTVIITFPEGTRTGRWYIADLYFSPCRGTLGFPLMAALPDTAAYAFNVHARKG